MKTAISFATGMPRDIIPPSRKIPLIILIGLPGSGKSTLAQHLCQTDPGRSLISTDQIRGQLFGDEAEQGPWRLIERELHRQFREVREAIATGQATEAIFDATNAVRRNRRQILQLARQKGFTHLTGLWLDVPLPICLYRNANRDRQVPETVIQSMYRCLEGAPPGLSEGFDQLIRYSGFSPLTPPQESVA